MDDNGAEADVLAAELAALPVPPDPRAYQAATTILVDLRRALPRLLAGDPLALRDEVRIGLRARIQPPHLVATGALGDLLDPVSDR